jgi:CheY-like chemotaxis protein
MIMNHPENDKWLDEALSETIGSEKSRTDFEEWKQRHPEAVEMLTSRTSRTSREVLEEIERRQKMLVRKRAWKVAAVIALICTGVVAATVVAIKIHNYRVVDKNPERGYVLVSEDGRTGTNVHMADSPEQAIEIAEETALLRQQGKREIVGVVEIEVNGQLDSRTLSFEYKLSDDRTRKVGERDPYADYPRTLTREQRDEMRHLWHKQLDTVDPRKFITTEEKQVYGSVFSFDKWKLVLSDGTEVTYSIGRPK